MPAEQIDVGSWNELVAVLEEFSPSWVFRGHASAQWPLSTTLERHAPLDQAQYLSEAQFLREFRRRAHNYLAAHEMPTSTGEWFALMQHHGAPTRLLDVTRSPYVAAYFALEDPPPDGARVSSIWAIDPLWCARRSGAEALKHNPALAQAVERSFELLNGIVSREQIAAMHLTKPLHETDTTLGVGNPALLPYEPLKLSDRMSVQQGLFIVPGDVELSVMENLAALGSADGVKKIVLPSAAVRGRGLEQLRLMNITRASLFHGLDGFAQSFRQLLVKETREQRDARLVLDALVAVTDPLRRRAVQAAASTALAADAPRQDATSDSVKPGTKDPE